MRLRLAAVALAAATILVGAGCGGSDDSEEPVAADLVAVVGEAGAPGDLVLLPPDDSEVRTVEVHPETPTVAGVSSPAWSAEGTAVVVTGTFGVGATDLFTADVPSGRAARLTDTSSSTTPRVSRDGRTVAYAHIAHPGRGSPTSTLWVADADDPGPRPLLPDLEGRTDVPGGFSPDGATLAFTRTGPGDRAARAVWVIRLDGTGARRLRAGSSPAWSPDGDRIVFVDPDGELATMAPDGGDVRRLTRSADAEDDPTWSPDGARIAFERGNGQVSSVWSVNPDGTCEGPLLVDPAGRISYSDPAWRPDAAPGPRGC